jgi:predicted GIY-YIG superfamily endonuclease
VTSLAGHVADFHRRALLLGDASLRSPDQASFGSASQPSFFTGSREPRLGEQSCSRRLIAPKLGTSNQPSEGGHPKSAIVGHSGAMENLLHFVPRRGFPHAPDRNRRPAACKPSASMDATPKRFVYVLRSLAAQRRHYVGVTSNVAERLNAHNKGHLPNTARYRPWQISVVVEFIDELHAINFEKYLKSGSGRAFAKRHFD